MKGFEKGSDQGRDKIPQGSLFINHNLPKPLHSICSIITLIANKQTIKIIPVS